LAYGVHRYVATGSFLDLEGRLERAKFHLDDLNVQIEQFLGREPWTTERGRDLKDGGYVLKIASHEPVPPIFGLIAADFVHDLRALLDNLIWGIAPAKLKRNWNLAFPICLDRSTFDEFAKAVCDGLMPAERVDALERHQPYHRRADVDNDRLCILHKMWNADKHHAPMGVMGWAIMAAAATYGDVPLVGAFGFRVGPLGKDQEVGWVSAKGAEYDLHPRVTLDIGFKTRRPTMDVPRHALVKMHDIVANEVLPDFRPFF
jgi:hypothetical protein